MSLKDKVRFVCLGNYGCKQGRIFADMGYKAMFANGSEQDLKLLGNMQNIYRLRGFDGFGGHRERALECLAQNEEFVEALQKIEEEIIFIIYADGGSTGSGSSIICEEILLEDKDEDGVPVKVVCPINALPASNESAAKHKNAYQAVKELQEVEGLGATFFINNDSSEDYNYINMTFAKLLDAFLTNDSYGERNNFDESEKMEMLRNDGAMVLRLASVNKESQSILDKLTQGGIFAPVEADMVCENVAIVHAGKNDSDITAGDVIAEVGKPANVFEGFNGRCTLIAVSGLSYPVSHVRKLGELAVKVSEERKRSKSMAAQKLDDLDLDLETTVKVQQVKQQKKPSKLEALRQKQAKMKK